MEKKENKSTALALGLVSSGLGAMGNLYNNDLQDQRTRESRNWSVAQQDRANLYNLPLNQLRRLKAAGLNPDLLYGDAANVAATAPDNTSPMAPETGGISNGVLAFLQMKQLQNQEELVESQTKLNESNAKKIESETDLNKGTLGNQPRMFEDIHNEFVKSMQEADKRIDLTIATAGKTLSEKDTIDYMRRFSYKQEYDLLENLKLRNNSLDKGLQVSDAQIKKDVASAKLYFSGIALNKSQIALNDKVGNYYDALTDRTSEEIDYTKSLAGLNWQALKEKRVLWGSGITFETALYNMENILNSANYTASATQLMDKKVQWFDIQAFSTTLESLSGSYSNVATGFKGFTGGFKKMPALTF